MNKKNRHLGFTLVELLVSISITMIAAAILFQIFIQSTNLFYSQRNKVDQGLSLSDSLSAINDQVRISDAVIASYTNGPTTYTSGLNSLVLQLPGIDTSGNNLTSTFDYATVSMDVGNPKILRLQVFPNAASHRKPKNQVLTSNLSKVNFFYYDNNNNVVSPAGSYRVNITLNVLEAAAFKSTPSSGSSDVNLRNN